MKKTASKSTPPTDRARRAALGSLLALPLAARAAAQTKAAAAPTDGSDAAHADLLAVREGVWRSWFAGDRKALLAILPADFVGIGSGDGAIRNRDEAIADAEGFAQAGNRLTDLRFSENRIQSIGPVRVLYGRFSFTFADKAGKANTVAGRFTEVFVREGRRWSHPGWHLDSGR